MKIDPLYIAVDFDGTCVAHDFPRVGAEIGAAPVLRELVKHGHRLILYTMRCDHNEEPKGTDPEIVNVKGNHLSAAEAWFKKHRIPLYGVQVNPTQGAWTSSNKCYAHLYLDDAALGAPLKFDPAISHRPFFDWDKTRQMLIELKLLPKPAEREVNKTRDRNQARTRTSRQDSLV
jgi:hypothetical protein